MKFAFCIFKYFPFGGQQKNFLQIAKACMSRGHEVDIFTTSWQGETPENFNVSFIPLKGFTHHRQREFLAKKLYEITSENNYDIVVGFIKIPGIDVYYAADTCFAVKAGKRSFLYRSTGRCRSYLRLEREVFGKLSKTHILLLSEQEKTFFIKYYDTPEQRFHLLPPGISKDRLAPPDVMEIRNELRRELNIDSNKYIALMAGSGFKTKGVDRSIRAISALPDEIRKKTVLLVVGKGNAKPYKLLSWFLGVSAQVRFMGGRKDIQRFFMAADLLIHPAYLENTGTVLIESMAAGLPVLVTDVCGYSYHIERAGSGEIIPSPFKQTTFNRLLAFMLTSKKKDEWQRNGKEYVARVDVFSRAEKAADIIEQVALSKNAKIKN